MRFFCILLLIFLSVAYSFLLPRINRPHLNLKVRCVNIARDDAYPATVTLPWMSPKYPPNKIEEWWRKKKDSLMTVGKPGLTPTLINSVREMMESHWQIKMKLAHDKIDAWEVANKVVSDPSMGGKVEILAVRKKMIMFGQVKVLLPFQY